jgi:hypothetical protein
MVAMAVAVKRKPDSINLFTGLALVSQYNTIYRAY